MYLVCMKMNGSKIESGLQLFSRLHQRPYLQNLNQILFHEGGPYPNDLIEIAGNTGTGKTLFLMDFLARCVLLEEYNGKGCGAIIINTDHHFDLFRFIEMLDFLIRKSGNKNVSTTVVEDSIKNALKNLIVLNCYDYYQLQMTFLNLEQILCDNENVGLITIDSLSSYYWEYRNINSTIISLQNYHSKMLESLQNQVKNFNIVVVFTTNEIELKLDVCWKILLRDCKSQFQALVTNINKNSSKTINYVIEKAIQYLN